MMIHFLHEGRALCAAHGCRAPREWPLGERWASIGGLTLYDFRFLVGEVEPTDPSAARADLARRYGGEFCEACVAELCRLKNHRAVEGDQVVLRVPKTGPEALPIAEHLAVVRACDDAVHVVYASGASIERAFDEEWTELSASLNYVIASPSLRGVESPPTEFGLWVWDGGRVEGSRSIDPHFSGRWRRPTSVETEAIASGRRPWPQVLEPTTGSAYSG